MAASMRSTVRTGIFRQTQGIERDRLKTRNGRENLDGPISQDCSQGENDRRDRQFGKSAGSASRGLPRSETRGAT